MNLDQISIFAYSIIIFASNAEATSSCLEQWLDKDIYFGVNGKNYLNTITKYILTYYNNL